jgi:hypothetical protein
MPSTKDASNKWAKMLVYGGPGRGKTLAIRTAPRPFILTSENRLQSLKDEDIQYEVIPQISSSDSACGLLDYLGYIKQWDSEQFPYDTVCIDSITDFAAAELQYLKKIPTKQGNQAHGMQAFYAVQEKVLEICRAIRHIDKHFYVTAHLGSGNIAGTPVSLPALPGKALDEQIAYQFDQIILAAPNEEDNPDMPNVWHTKGGTYYVGKDSSNGSLAAIERPDIGNIINKIYGINNE